MTNQFDDAVVGAGILGLAHAYHLALRGRKVAVFEKRPRACGASTRNFGMIWPVGQPPGPLRRLALRSRDLWLDLLRQSDCWHESRGSLHVAYHDDEWQVLREFATDFAEGLCVELVSPARVRELCPRVKPEGLRGGLFSASEVCVDARRACADLTTWLSERFGVRFCFDHAVSAYDQPTFKAGGTTLQAERLWVCTGEDAQTLFPEAYANFGLIPCKLQMMRSQPFPDRLGPMLAAGLTLRHYAGFANCPTLPAVKARVGAEQPELDRLGIHVMASQNSAGELIIGDSHEYGAAIEPYDKPEIDRIILDYLDDFLDVPELQITARWHGIYLKHPAGTPVTACPAPGVTLISGVGGAGMTLSFGVAEQSIRERLGNSI